MIQRTVLSLIALLAQGAPAFALEGIEPDRPFSGLTSQTLEQGLYQLEQGVRYDAVSTFTFPSLHRLGLGSGCELLLESPLVTLANGESRMADLSVGAKWRFVEGGAWGEAPAMGLVALAELGAEGQLRPRMALALDTALPGALKLGTNLGTYVAADDSARARVSAAIAWSLVERLRIGVELVGETDLSAGGPQWGVNTGVGWMLEPSTQLDMLVYKGMTPQVAEWSASFGVSRGWGM